MIQYSYMSAVFWLTSISYFMWKSFKAIKITLQKQQSTYGYQIPIFKWYAIVCWGCPLLMTIITLIMQHLDECQKDKSSLICPKLETTCFFETDTARWLYFDIINAPLLVNIIFSILPIFLHCSDYLLLSEIAFDLYSG